MAETFQEMAEVGRDRIAPRIQSAGFGFHDIRYFVRTCFVLPALECVRAQCLACIDGIPDEK